MSAVEAKLNEKAASHLLTPKHLKDLENGYTELYDVFHALVNIRCFFFFFKD